MFTNAQMKLLRPLQEYRWIEDSVPPTSMVVRCGDTVQILPSLVARGGDIEAVNERALDSVRDEEYWVGEIKEILELRETVEDEDQTSHYLRVRWIKFPWEAKRRIDKALKTKGLSGKDRKHYKECKKKLDAHFARPDIGRWEMVSTDHEDIVELATFSGAATEITWRVELLGWDRTRTQILRDEWGTKARRLSLRFHAELTEASHSAATKADLAAEDAARAPVVKQEGELEDDIKPVVNAQERLRSSSEQDDAEWAAVEVALDGTRKRRACRRRPEEASESFVNADGVSMTDAKKQKRW